MPASQNIRPQFYNILINMVTNCFKVGHLVLYNPSKCQAATKVWGWRINNSIQKHKVLTTTRESNRVVRYQLLSWNIPSFCLTIQQHQVKKSKINILTHQYKLFNMEEVESIDEMFSRFTVIISDLKSLEKT